MPLQVITDQNYLTLQTNKSSTNLQFSKTLLNRQQYCHNIYCYIQTFLHIQVVKSSDQRGIMQILSYLIENIRLFFLCNCVYSIVETITISETLS